MPRSTPKIIAVLPAVLGMTFRSNLINRTHVLVGSPYFSIAHYPCNRLTPVHYLRSPFS